MALGFSQMGSAIGGFFGDDKLKQRHFNRPLAGLYGKDYITGLKSLRDSGTEAIQNFKSELDAATPQARQLQQEDISNIGHLLRRNLQYDPLDAYERIRSGNIDALTQQFGNIAEHGSAADKLALAARGYGGRGDGTYERVLRADRISRNIAPVLNTIFGNLGSDATIAERNRIGNILASLGLMEERSQIPDRIAGRSLVPWQAQASMLGDELALARDLGAGSRENTSGFQLKKNKWKNFFEQKGAAMDELGGTAMNLAAMYFGGGLGGMAGGLGGMGGGMSTAAIGRGAAMGGAMGASTPGNFWSLSPQQQNQYFNQWRWAQGYPGPTE